MSITLFHTALYASLVLCALGLIWRVSAWFRVRVGPDTRAVTPLQRMAAAMRGAVAALFSRRLFRVLGALLLDVLLLRRLYANAKLRWIGHQLIMVGFTLLLLMHALAALVSEKLFPDYQPTLEPYLFLRNLLGVMVLVGVGLLFFGRRRERSGFAPARAFLGTVFVLLLGFVLATGFLLEAHKIASPRAFYRMAEQYAGTTDAEQLKPLRALWASEFGVAFADLQQPIAADLVERGRELQRDACASCHAKPAFAFVSYPLAQLLAPVTGPMDAARADIWLWYLHVFACLLGLASLPFTRFFHVLAAPISLLVDAAAPRRALSAQPYAIEARASQRALALDACVRCGICDARCSVAPLARYLGNPGLLPSHKLIATGALTQGRLLRAGQEDHALRAAEGAFLCTDCGRCTSCCPVGLDLEDLWQAGRGDLAAAGLPAPAQWVQAGTALTWAEALEAVPGPRGLCGPDAVFAPLSADRRSFSRCVQCQTCTNVCPVVAHSMDAEHGVDLTPQKVMNLLRLGLSELALGSRMVWDCASCYQCQESCPEGVRVADIMCELRALAVRRLGAVRGRRQAA
ncbi:MAG: 4Fe-4S dicluster domain-containing protein [Burkholderiales bacterium]|jgi:heterodisulfide reductase subunit C